MPRDDISKRTYPVKTPMRDVPETFGTSRAAVYRAAAAGYVRLSKLGRTTLVDTQDMLAYLDGLPTLHPKQAA